MHFEAVMRIRVAALVLALLAGPGLAHASGYADAAKQLNGTWYGDGEFVLRIDAKRAQASMTPDRPFEWHRFLIKQVGEGDIVFSIGAELYEAMIDANTLTLTGTSFRGKRVLYREPALRGTTSQ